MNFLVSIKGVLVEAARFSHRSATAPPPLTMKLGLGYKTDAMYGNSHSAMSRKGRQQGVEMEIKGGCLCGAVRYTAEADPTSAQYAIAGIAKNSPAAPLPRWFV